METAQIVYDNYYEPNPNSYCAYLLQPNGVDHFNLIDKQSDEDWFRITASQGNTYTAILSEENAVDVRMDIYFENADHSLTEIVRFDINSISMDVCHRQEVI